MTPGTLDADLRSAAAAHVDRTAVVAGGQRLSYGELDRRVDGFAAGLHALGVRRGDRVAVILRNSVESAVAIYGIVRAGAAFVALNPTTKEEKLAHLLGHCGAVAAVCDPDIVARVRASASRVGGFRRLVVTGDGAGTTAEETSFGALVAHEPAELGEVLETDLAAIIYTSGSTGVPKGAVFLHRNMHFVAGSVIDYLGLVPEDRILCVLPLSHTYGLYHLIMAVRTGATLVLEHGIAFPGRVVKALDEERVTVLPGLPTVWQILLSLRGRAERGVAHVRVVTNAGAALSATRLAEVRSAFPQARFYSMYGQTECARVCYLPPDQLDTRPGSVGVAIPGTEVWIEDEDGNAVAPGEVGELMIRGDHVMQGYWGDAAATARKLEAGRFPGDRVLRSGDLFRVDEGGYLYFVARQDDIIKSGGEKIAPREIEEVLYTAVGVREAAVVGVDHELLGQAVVAHVSALSGHELDEKALRRHCAAQLEDYMVPRRVVIHDELPKTDNGKLDKLALTAQAPATDR